MTTNKKYVKPCISIIEIRNSKMLCSSDSMNYTCSEICKLWHLCKDRHKGKYCLDKKYN